MLLPSLIVELDAQNSSAETACFVTGNDDPQQDSIVPVPDVCRELSNVLSAEKDLRYRLVYYALKNIRLYFSADSFNSLTAHDVVQIVIEKILTGIRKWNKSLVPDIRKLLFLSIKSFIRNEKARANIPVLLDIDTMKPVLNDHAMDNFLSEMHLCDLNNNAFAADIHRLVSKLKTLLTGDIYASFVLDEILEGAGSNIEIAKSLNIPVRDVENAKKRIRNKSAKLIKNGG
ncbi:MAG: sigma-70 family RNA polymerase sigma factor [bacterium]|nr:sigma-70 family RNA polymerase sigma factor [bacterium]